MKHDVSGGDGEMRLGRGSWETREACSVVCFESWAEYKVNSVLLST